MSAPDDIVGTDAVTSALTPSCTTAPHPGVEQVHDVVWQGDPLHVVVIVDEPDVTESVANFSPVVEYVFVAADALPLSESVPLHE
jgi:hypothetical protein